MHEILSCDFSTAQRSTRMKHIEQGRGARFGIRIIVTALYNYREYEMHGRRYRCGDKNIFISASKHKYTYMYT